MPTQQINVSNVKLELDDLLVLIRHLDAEARRRVAQVLAEAEMDSRFSELIRQLAAKPAVDEITDAEIDLEVGAFRQQRRA